MLIALYRFPRGSTAHTEPRGNHVPTCNPRQLLDVTGLLNEGTRYDSGVKSIKNAGYAAGIEYDTYGHPANTVDLSVFELRYRLVKGLLLMLGFHIQHSGLLTVELDLQME
jgi:hypothetical protein